MDAMEMIMETRNTKRISENNLWVVPIMLLLHSLSLQPVIVSCNDAIDIGVVVNPGSRIGKEQRVGMEIAAQEFNSVTKKAEISLHFGSSNGSNPLQAAFAAAYLLEHKNVRAIIGAESWQEAMLLGEIGSQYKVPILSLATPPSTTTDPWPFLVSMGGNYSEEISCITSLVKYYGWRSVVAVYEDDDGYSSENSLMLKLLSLSLQDVGSLVEYNLALPPFASMVDPKEMITQELIKVLSKQCRVFVVLYSSLPMAIHLFREANNMGLVGIDTAWIVTDSIASLLDSMNSSTISYMEGTLGIRSHYDEHNKNFKHFSRKFALRFLSENPSEESFHPGMHALRAYDAVKAIAMAINMTSLSMASMESISTINFVGLSGKISFKNGELGEENRTLEEGGKLLRVINVVGRKYKELDFFSSEKGFFKTLIAGQDESSGNEDGGLGAFNGSASWAGDSKDVPRGWAMPTNAKPLRIGVPGRTSFEKFVKVENGGNPNRTTYSGLCIDIFLEVVKIIEESYALPYEFEAFYGTYDELVMCVYNKTFDAAVGDITILENRSKYVEFSQPFTKSWLTVIVPLRSEESQKAWMFTKPFSWQMWLAAFATLLYTMLLVWFTERENNTDFGGGDWHVQLSAALWFTFASLFFAHRENIQSNYARIAVVVWLFVVFILTSSYTASLTSMLTVPLKEPSVKNIDSLRDTGAKVGCDGGSFVLTYLKDTLHFREGNIINVSSEYSYPEALSNGNISAAFIELPYAKAFFQMYCKDFTQTKERFRFGGQGFVFQKGSPLAADVSKAILKLSEGGVLKELNDKWFSPSPECSSSSNTEHEIKRLGIQGFGVLYLLSGAISTVCFFLCVARLFMSCLRNAQSISSIFDHHFTWQYFGRPETPIVERPLAIFDARHPHDDWVEVRWDDMHPTPTSGTNSSAVEMSSFVITL